MAYDEGMPQDNTPGAEPPSASPPDLSVAYDKLREARGRMDVIKNLMGKLVGMGDMVTQEDVIKAASKIVAAGVDAKGLAAMLADMPEKGELIAPWLAQHQQDIVKKEQQLDSVMGQVQHHMGSEALRQIVSGAAPASGNLGDMGALAPASAAGGSAPANPLALE